MPRHENVSASTIQGGGSNLKPAQRAQAARFLGLWILCLAGMLAAPAAFGAETLVFWSSGYPAEVQDLLRRAIFPEFEAQHGIRIEYKEIGWGGPRDEQLVVAAAGGVGPDVYVNGTAEIGAVPLDEYVEAWEERSSINDAFWEIVRWMSRGQLLYVPQIVEIRGYAYNKRPFMEAGLSTDPPGSWEEMLDYVRKLTQVDEASGRVVRSGFETTWNAPYVANEYDWFIQQAGAHLTTPDLKTSLIDTPEGHAALEYMLELYRITHPPGYQPIDRFEFNRGGVAITRGLASTKQQLEQVSPDDVAFFGLFAPRRNASTRPVAPTLVNGLSIASWSDKKDLAWEFIKFLMSVEALDGRISPGEAILRMAHAHQVALDRLYGGN